MHLRLALAIAIGLLPSAATAAERACHGPAATTPAGPTKTPSFADVKVVTQDGRTVDFYRDLVQDKIVAVNFIFTTCTTVCPPMGAIFGQLQKINAGVGRDVHLISVTIDPAADTPQRLKSWASKFGARAGWTLVTGEKDDITRLLKSMDAYVTDFRNHQGLTLVGNEASRNWRRSYGFTTAARINALLQEVR